MVNILQYVNKDTDWVVLPGHLDIFNPDCICLTTLNQQEKMRYHKMTLSIDLLWSK